MYNEQCTMNKREADVAPALDFSLFLRFCIAIIQPPKG